MRLEKPIVGTLGTGGRGIGGSEGGGDKEEGKRKEKEDPLGLVLVAHPAAPNARCVSDGTAYLLP